FTNLKELKLQYQNTSPVRYQPTYTLASLPDEIGNITSLEKLYLNNNTLTALPSTITNLSNLEYFNIQNNKISGVLNLGNSEVLKDFRADYNNISELKIAVAPTIFGTNTNASGNRLRLKRNALGCVEVPSDELVAWKLSNYNQEGGILDNGVVYSDNCSAVTTNSIPDIEREALIAFYNNTKGANWKNDLTTSYNGVTWVNDILKKRNVGAWYGVTTAIINGQKHVTKIELNSNQLAGKIPSEIKNLTQLKELEVNSNGISEISKDIGELNNLEQLTMSSQIINSEYVLKEIPTELNNITSLKRLVINGNIIEGNLDFSNLVNLESLNVSYNQITGLKIGVSPNVFDGSRNVESNYYKNHSLYNTYLNCIGVPQNTISDWEATDFAIRYPNIVWGQDCTAYNNVPSTELQALKDMYNNLEGTNWTSNTNWESGLAKVENNIPYNVTKWHGVTTKIVDGGKHITQINLGNNNLKGTVSSSLGNLSKLESLYLSSNDLTGVLPSELSNLSSLIRGYFQDNSLSGDVPDFTGITSLKTLYISNNSFQFGDFEDEFNNYQNLESFSYSPQSKVGAEEEKTFGDSGFTLEVDVNGANNEYQWYRYGSPINGATNKTLEITNATAADNGYYYCKVTNKIVSNLIIQSEKITMTYDTSLSVEDENLVNSFKLYPNPVEDVIFIKKSLDSKINKIEIYNLLGKKVKVIRNVNSSINVTQLSKGVYLLKIDTDKGLATKRIIKK
ncbi:T9SS type A sorting domain-containing protein, partial [Polaribacter sp. Z022]|uniref:T9SS type A sorting domain-containing protein n=1 Tax=Polaribacter sp. Z022 TaxID=2927125 RepID=UPI00202060C0